MKKFASLACAAIIGLTACGEADMKPEEAGIGTFSEGYRIGQISKYSVKGNSIVGRSGEGEMLVGNESTFLRVSYSCGEGGRDTCYKVINPWQFSSTTTFAGFISEYLGEYAVIKYRQAKLKSSTMSTDYIVVDIFSPTDPQALAVDSCTSATYDEAVADTGKWSQGTRVGRIVKLSSKGNFNKSYEATIQVGNSGSQFHYMSIVDGETPAQQEYISCLYQMMFAGVKVKVDYAEDLFYNPTQRDTAYDMIRVRRASTGLAE